VSAHRRSSHLAATCALGLLHVLVLVHGCSRPPAEEPERAAADSARAEDPTVALRGVLLPPFQTREPAVRAVRVLEILARPGSNDPGFVVMARGHAADDVADGDPVPTGGDRIGLFEVDLDLGSVLRVVDVFAAPDSLPELRLSADRESLFVSARPTPSDSVVARWSWPYPLSAPR
jgi:hypothetical protein